jgi:hypothetical protein
MNRSSQVLTVCLATLGAALLLTACGSVRIEGARLALPEALVDGRPDVRVERLDGAGHGRSGQTTLAGTRVRFERGADALSLFGRLSLDRVQLTLDLNGTAAGDASRGRCSGTQVDVQVGGGSAALATRVKPLGLECRFDGPSPATLRLEERTAGGGRMQREGTLETNGPAAPLRLVLRSLHQLQGAAPMQLEPLGYLVEVEGRAVAAVDLTSATPRVRRIITADAALDRSITQAALVLALLFEPANALR